MAKAIKIEYLMLALLCWSANFLCGCTSGGGVNASVEIDDIQKLPTMSSDTLTITSSRDGKVEYRFKTPRLERYEKAEEPYMLFPVGVEIETFQDSTKERESFLRADWATFNEIQELWEAKGNVVGININGDTLYTQQIFWDQKEQMIYSNVDTKVKTAGQIVLGDGFTSNERLDDITLGSNRGRFLVDMNEQPSDSTSMEEAEVEIEQEQESEQE